MLPRIRPSVLSECGQGLTEYLLIFLPLVAIIALGVLTILVSGSS
jgi:hypothetical protein